MKLDKVANTVSTFFGTLGTCGSGANQLGSTGAANWATGICIDRTNNKMYVVSAR
jgi:hypothetical protein